MLNAREKREWPKSSLGKDTFHVCHVLSFYEVCAGGVALSSCCQKGWIPWGSWLFLHDLFLFLLLYLFLDGKEDQRKVEEQIGDTYCTVVKSQTRLFLWTNKALELFVCQLKFFRKHHLNENAVSNRLSYPRKRTLFEKRVQLTSLYRP